MKTYKTYALSLVAGYLIGIGPIFAAGWDTSFPSFPTLSAYERISAVHYLNASSTAAKKLYVAVNYDDGSLIFAYLYRLDGSIWNVVPNSSVGGKIYALSGGSSSYGDRLFVGGSFTYVGPSSVIATNIAMLNPTPTNNPTWQALVTAGKNGADGTVTSLAAYQWWDIYFGSAYDSILLFVGGEFTNAGNNYSPSIADWRGIGYLWASTWEAIGSGSGGYGVDNDAYYRTVYGIAADIQRDDVNSTSYINGLYLTGNFRKTVGTVVNNDVVKMIGSTWRNLGRGLLKGGIDPYTCEISFNPYPSMWGYSAVFANGTAYLGGFFDDAQDKNGTNYFEPFTDPSCCGHGYGYQGYVSGVCSFYTVPIAKISGTEILSTSSSFLGPTLNGIAYSMSTVGSMPFVGGSFGSSYAAKLVSGVWQALPGTGSPNGPPTSSTADSTSAYFATASSVFRYIN